MKIGVISDTHGNIAALRRALELFHDVDLIVHAGDVLYHPPRLGCTDSYDVSGCVELLNALSIPIVIAQGNCDAAVYEELLEVPLQFPYAYVVYDNANIIVSHGHALLSQQMIELGRRFHADYLISGHTHVPELRKVDGMTVMNPGSPAIPKHEVDGRLVPSIGFIEDSGARVINLNNGESIASLSPSPE